ncbi:MAG TPA: sensor histidine kinase, partial [Candidatus Deferrimicrobium sp.]|nr:sensor histidine kinase [Candidatus Deferrimicrobium sp.]
PSALRARRLAWGTWLFSVALLVASLVMLALDWPAIDSLLTAQALFFLEAAIVGILGALIATRRPGNLIGWLLLAIAVAEGELLLANFAGIRGLLSGVSPRGWVQVSAALVNGTGGFGFFLLGFVILLFPDGRLLPGPRWRWAAWVAGVVVVAMIATTVVAVAPIQLSPRLPSVPNALAVPALDPFTNGGGLLGAVGSFSLFVFLVAEVVVRFRRSRDDERRQLRWFAYVAGGGLGLLLASFPISGLPIGTVTSDLAGVCLTVLVPATIGLAVMRHGLYDIDVFISRGIVYGSLAVFITAVYVGIAVGIGALVGSGGKPNLGLSILATAIVAVGFQPVRERVQRVANRLVYGKRATPYEVLSQFSERVAESYASDDVLPRMARVLADGTAAELAEVWLRSGDGLRREAAYPFDPASPAVVHVDGMNDLSMAAASRTVEVRHQGELLGALTVTKRRGESLTPIELKLMDDLANQAGLVLKNVGLTSDLQARLVDLRASRQRLVAAQDDERRKLERNLHDGAQQHLVAIKVKLGLAEMLLTRDPEKATTTLVALKHDADEALETLRDLARGIYPPLLAEKGLAAALRSQARKATIPVEVDADGISRHSQETEAALYFCTLEALQNVQKYASAAAVVVRLREDAERLRVEVTDDGRGFNVASVRRGAGLTNMEDRLDALGGTLEIVSTPGAGTTLRASIPTTNPVPVERVNDVPAHEAAAGTPA